MLPVEPLSSIRPRSLLFEPVLPEPSSINASSIVVLVALLVTVEPLTVRLPVITTLPLAVTSVAAISAKVTSEVVDTSCPILIAGSHPSPALPLTVTPVPPVTLST